MCEIHLRHGWPSSYDARLRGVRSLVRVAVGLTLACVAWLLHKCVALWKAVYGTERPLGLFMKRTEFLFCSIFPSHRHITF